MVICGHLWSVDDDDDGDDDADDACTALHPVQWPGKIRLGWNFLNPHTVGPGDHNYHVYEDLDDDDVDQTYDGLIGSPGEVKASNNSVDPELWLVVFSLWIINCGLSIFCGS